MLQAEKLGGRYGRHRKGGNRDRWAQGYSVVSIIIVVECEYEFAFMHVKSVEIGGEEKGRSKRLREVCVCGGGGAGVQALDSFSQTYLDHRLTVEFDHIVHSLQVTEKQ